MFFEGSELRRSGPFVREFGIPEREFIAYVLSERLDVNLFLQTPG